MIEIKALICKIGWMSRYHGEDDCFFYEKSIKKGKESTNFINFNGTYYGYIHTESLEFMKGHHQLFDYVIFCAFNQEGSCKVIGWYKDAMVFKDEQLFSSGCPYFIKASDQNVVLLDENKRNLSVNFSNSYQIIEVEKNLLDYLNNADRINYRNGDELIQASIDIESLEVANQLIENELYHENYLKALNIVAKSIKQFGKLTTLLYYQAYIFYLFQQYHRAVIILSELTKTKNMREFAIFLLGNIFFDTEGYQESINVLTHIKEVNVDQSAYIISQSYAMMKNPGQAMEWIDKALAYMPTEESYLLFKKQLEEWES